MLMVSNTPYLGSDVKVLNLFTPHVSRPGDTEVSQCVTVGCELVVEYGLRCLKLLSCCSGPNKLASLRCLI